MAAHIPITPIPGDLMFFFSVSAGTSHSGCIGIHAGKTPIHTQKSLFWKRKDKFPRLVCKSNRWSTLYNFSWEDAQKWPSTSDRVLAAGHKIICPSLLWLAHEFTSYLREHKWLRQLHLPRVHAGMGDRQRCQSGSLEVCAQFARVCRKKCLWGSSYSTVQKQGCGFILA